MSIGTIAELTLTSDSEIGSEIGQEAVTFTGITAIDVLKESANKFYLAVGDSTDNSNTGKVVVFEGTDSEFSTLTQTFEVLGDNAGDWFGWSVKLALLDRDGDTATLSHEPVLFVGAPKATIGSTSGVGYVKVFDISGGDIQTITPLNSTAYNWPRVLSVAATSSTSLANVRAFGYSVSGSMHTTPASVRSIPFGMAAAESYLFVGAPESYSGEGAVFVYRWSNGVRLPGAVPPGGEYALKGVVSPTVKGDLNDNVYSSLSKIPALAGARGQC